MPFKKISAEVCVSDEDIVKVGPTEIALLKQSLEMAPRGRVRLCAHSSPSDRLHEMIIALAQSTYVRPHKHANKSESFHVISGLADITMLDNQGNIIEVIPLGEPGSGRPFFYRLQRPIFHTLLIRSEVFIIHEVTNGPFAAEDTVFADWAPDEGDDAAAKAYIRALSASVAQLSASDHREFIS
jgi:cupin fold WbuC family metalloprotein